MKIPPVTDDTQEIIAFPPSNVPNANYGGLIPDGKSTPHILGPSTVLQVMRPKNGVHRVVCLANGAVSNGNSQPFPIGGFALVPTSLLPSVRNRALSLWSRRDAIMAAEGSTNPKNNTDIS
jgi:hypothetical protein